MAKTITLTQGKKTIVDDEDFRGLTAHRWKAHRQTADGSFYATSNKWDYSIQGYRFIQMHRVLMDAQPGQVVDHINGNTLDNRRSNLRLATVQENACNKKVRADNKTGFKGVIRKGRGYQAMIMVNKKQTHLGSYDTAEKAYEAYCSAAKKLHGEFARLL
jgi:hypothetical protein